MKVNKKINILYLFPGPEHRPDMPSFKDRFEMLSEYFQGEVYCWSWGKNFEYFKMGNFVYRGLARRASGWTNKFDLALHIFRNALRYHRTKRVDVIVCYEPMFTGIVGAVLKMFLRCKLIVEVPSENYAGAVIEFYGRGIAQYLKAFIFKIMSSISLSMADCIKVLTSRIKEKLPSRFSRKKIFIFHDFVPTHYFDSTDAQVEPYILFIGYPFELKGVDCLIRAFKKISHKFQDFHLRLIGHEIEKEARTVFSDLEKIDFLPGVFFDEIKIHFQYCYCFVLPSRTEGMGRVLVEAMACGKPVIGSNVGGIPNVIQEGRNGFLFESENVDDLADKLERVLSNPGLAKRMGEEGLKIVEEKFSSEKYVEHFKRMMDKVLNEN